jgi:hypothetical protein
MDNIERDLKVFLDELRRKGVVRQNAAHLGSRYENVMRTLLCEELLDGNVIPEIELLVRPQDKVFESERSQTSHESRANEPAVPRNVDLRIVIHR